MFIVYSFTQQSFISPPLSPCLTLKSLSWSSLPLYPHLSSSNGRFHTSHTFTLSLSLSLSMYPSIYLSPYLSIQLWYIYIYIHTYTCTHAHMLAGYLIFIDPDQDLPRRSRVRRASIRNSTRPSSACARWWRWWHSQSRVTSITVMIITNIVILYDIRSLIIVIAIRLLDY